MTATPTAEKPSQAALSTWVDSYFDAKDRDDLQALVSVMTEQDVARTFEIIDEQATRYELVFADFFNTYIYVCQEDVPWNTAEG